MKRQAVEKPWGKFDQFTLNEASTVKVITVKKGQALSLQTHEHRSEFWRVLKGDPIIQIGDTIVEAFPGDEFMIHKKEAHRITAKAEDSEILEIAFGDFDEEDIVRLEDNYGRV